MELFDFQEYAAARQRDTMRSFRYAERSGLTQDRPERRPRGWFFRRNAETRGRNLRAAGWQTSSEG